MAKRVLVAEGSTMKEGKVGTAYFEEESGLPSERSVQESLNSDGSVSTSLQDKLKHISRPLIKTAYKNFHMKSRSKIKCRPSVNVSQNIF
ncbi:MAG: hypothetical protein CM1200mP1_16450 [Candidatus Neomarinimicrobiota bacterium]|nr:MAG: hypothetical protein CM1200mP1_16450 [Candidatus Neomarinimicrobiota bacterium]